MKIALILTLLTLQILTCPDKDERCGSCQSATCEFCYSSFISSTGKCVEPVTKIPNCLTYNSDGITCKQCIFHYSLINTLCVKIEDENCLRQDEKKNCLACSDKMTLISGKCSADKKCGLLNCKYCGFDAEKEICVLCDSGYSIFPTSVTDQCKSSSDSGCLSLNFYNEKECSLCKAGFYYKNGKCDSSSISTPEIEEMGNASGVLRFGVWGFLGVFMFL